MKKIICIGNRFIYPDGAALWIYDKVQNEHTHMKNNVSWIEGGLGGLNLITHFEDASEVLLLDYMADIRNASFVEIEAVIDSFTQGGYSHDSAFYYLLKSLPEILEKPPKVRLLSCNPENESYIDGIFTKINSWAGEK